MPEYGLTPQGPNIKRLDDILEDMHTGLSESWGVNTRQNPESLLNHLLTNFADAIAELWEFGEKVYYSQYPASAEGVSLDNAAQYGGSTREQAAKSYYPIHCNGIDNTRLVAGTTIASATNPITMLSLTEDRVISRSACNSAEIVVATLTGGAVYTVSLNESLYSVTAEEGDTANDVLAALAVAINGGEGFMAVVDSSKGVLTVTDSENPSGSNNLILSENLTTQTVTSVVNFGTEEFGDIYLPDGVITNIVRADAGLISVVNKCGYIPGREQETDTEFRQSYADKIFNRSSMMLESIRSAILNNVQGVNSVAAYENNTNVTVDGRPPHSIEIIVDGGYLDTEVAKQIFDKKAAGIQTYGSVEVTIPGQYDEDIVIRFNRPQTVYVWWDVAITRLPGAELPTQYAKLLKEVILKKMEDLDAGDEVIPQTFMTELYKACPGLAYIDISLYYTTDESATPTLDTDTPSNNDYTERIATITARQRAKTTDTMIGVRFGG